MRQISQGLTQVGQTPLRANNNNMIEQISSFIDKMKVQSKRRDSDAGRSQHSRSRSVQRELLSEEDDDDEEVDDNTQHEDHEKRAKAVADKVIIESERFKAGLIAPKGTGTEFNFQLPMRVDSQIELMRKFDNDDDFFLVSCHIDPLVKQKVERGEFVDLEKLLPKDKAAGGFSMSDDSRIRLCQEEGETFLAPVKSAPKINSIKKWDSAFRIYTTIFAGANPERGTELLQYAHIIHTAAANYPWENVAFYDFTFRHLMASKPWRSWAKTYTQGWNLALNSLSVSRNTSNGASTSYSNNNNNQKTRSFQQKEKDWRDKCCWRYGKNKCAKSAKECNYDHRCKFCGGWNHSYTDCKKRNPKQGGSNDQAGKPAQS